MTGTGPPLAAKLGVREGTTLTLLNEPDGLLGDLPAGVTVRRQGRGHAEVVVAFFTARRLLEKRMAALGRMVFPAGGLWIAWPKGASGVSTDVDDHAVRAVALPLGLVDNKVCALDATWTGLRLVWRRERRGGA
jgi:hypothetical protein